MKHIRLGIDLDGVVCNNLPVWSEFMNKRVPTCHPHLLSPERPPRWDSPYKACNKCFDEAIATPSVVESYELEPFCVYAIDMLYRAEVSMVVVTSRPDPVRFATIQYLKEKRLLQYFEAVRFADHDKLPVLLEEKLNFHVDDRPAVIEEMKGTSITPITFNQPYNQDTDGLRANTWLDVADLILERL